MSQPDRQEMTILHMRFTCWKDKATDTNSEYVTLLFFQHDNGHMKVPQYYVYIYISRLVKNYREQTVESKAHKVYFPTSFILKISSSAHVLAGYY